MSSFIPSQCSSIVSLSNHSARIVAQTNMDVKLNAEFEESVTSFGNSRSLSVPKSAVLSDQEQQANKVTTMAYLQKIQKGKEIQSFGCLVAVDEKTSKITAYSENAPEMLTMVDNGESCDGEHPDLQIGSDVRILFASPSASALEKVLGFGEVSLPSPVLVHCKASAKPFYAIFHRVTGSLIIDFEPVKPCEVPVAVSGALQSHKFAAKGIARLQSLPSGSLERLYDAVVQEVHELIGYDKVMVYKFHEDDHGEVVSEITTNGLGPSLGCHYPATDIPQASRFLFMKNKVRMICDCRAKHVKVLQDEKIPLELTLCGSTLRSAHSCHLEYMETMGTVASLVMAVVVNEGNKENGNSETAQPLKGKRLWGLVVCHSTTPRFIPFPLRYACEFLIQVFSIHVNKELELQSQVLEKRILLTQTLLCDLLMRNAPVGIVSENPNIMDLVKCDGAALLYKGKIWRL
ncbi:hypothetical protein GIB67_018459 [Kingdonia uniflora]|uniref:Phytochrome chromophore attachment site domain-containing protein n=1 Tax=Kingdonia uniflora TaxID=39325 RepID=A0A7J7LJP4_9MAGN|nr:hypothetical protein GIB67_018459 [Kingdonia uniflora]